MAGRACIFGLEGPALSQAEADFFRDSDPWGFIVFARNIETPDQVRKLSADLRNCVGREAPILIDQEGGRVQRLCPPHWRKWQPALDEVAAQKPENRYQVMALRYRLIAHELRQVGIDVNCAPMLDIATPESHDIITNRCYGHTADEVADIGRAVAESLLAGGVLPIIKHIPGHGRSDLDSHLTLPRVEASLEELRATDFVPFARLGDLPMAMSAHIIYPAIDPDNCATLSAKVIAMIRDEIGFDGLLMTDDLSMKALSGSFAERTWRALAAGCDMVLHCNGKPEEMEEVAGATPLLADVAKDRAEQALAARHAPDPFDAEWAEARLSELNCEVSNA